MNDTNIRISGTLKRKVNESIENRIVSKVLLLLVINFCYHQINYKTPTKKEVENYLDVIKRVASILKKHEGDSIKSVIRSVKVAAEKNYIQSKKHLITNKQFRDVMVLLDEDYSYQGDYIRDVLFKMIGRIKDGALSKKDLKLYILENDKIEYVLDKIGCRSIRFVSNLKGDDYYKCSNPDGNNKEAVRVYTNEYLNVSNFTRNLGDVADLFTLVQFVKGFSSFSQTLIYVNQILGITNLSDDELRMLSIEADAKKVEIEKESKNKRERELQEAKKRYQEALDKDSRLYNAAEPILNISWVKEGIIAPTRRKFGIKYFEYDGKHQQIIFPIKHYLTGKVIAYQRRLLIDEDEEYLNKCMNVPKYLVTEGYQKDENVYGLWENKDDIEKEGLLVIYESPKSVMKRWTRLDRTGTHNDCTGVAIQGHYLSKKQAEIIAQTMGKDFNRAFWAQSNYDLTGVKPKDIEFVDGVAQYRRTEVVVAFDKDVSESDILTACYRLQNTFESAGFKISYIFDKWGKLKNQESPADADRDTFDFLMKNRITFQE